MEHKNKTIESYIFKVSEEKENRRLRKRGGEKEEKKENLRMRENSAVVN